MAQYKTDYQETWPKCRHCGEVMKHKSGEEVSSEVYESLKGLCNDCNTKGGIPK